MKIKQLNELEGLATSPKLRKAYTQFNELINELNNRDLHEDTIKLINIEVDSIHSSNSIEHTLINLIRIGQAKIIRLVEKKHKIVPKNYYRKFWLVLGMSTFGLPLGVVVGVVIMENIGMLAIGLPLGMIIGHAVGSIMDKKAFKEGRQLNIDLKNGL